MTDSVPPNIAMAFLDSHARRQHGITVVHRLWLLTSNKTRASEPPSPSHPPCSLGLLRGVLNRAVKLDRRDTTPLGRRRTARL
jgi:hypothetical protein